MSTDSKTARRRNHVPSDRKAGKTPNLSSKARQTSVLSSRSIAIEWLESWILLALLCLSSRAVRNQFAPQHGASWNEPWWSNWLDLAVFGVGKVAAWNSPVSTQCPGDRSVIFLALASLQTSMYLSSDLLTPGRLHALKIVFFTPLLSYTWYRMSRATTSIVESGIGSPHGISQYLMVNSLDILPFAFTYWLQGWPVDSFVAHLPYHWLPSGFVIPWLTSVLALLAGIWSTSRHTKRRSIIWSINFATLCIAPVLFSLFFNTHSPLASTTQRLNKRLLPAGFELLARGDGRATGYTSVLQQNDAGFRALRCEHSLLGGFWLNGPGLVKDPIYGVFVILEAVRLMVPTGASEKALEQLAKRSKTGNVLNIGLGIGTAPAAFITHGMDVTIVEIDQIVYNYAVEYFELPPRHTAIIGDAIEFVHTEQRKVKTISTVPISGSESKQYDFIVHDVFTGGVEPAVLFTVEFLTGLRDLLQPHGSIAINYAGDFTLPSAQMVLRTILAVFGSCRIFRETEAGTAEVEDEGDQTNVVVFCRKQKGDWEFRKPNRSDFLRSPSREEWLLPRFEMDASEFVPECAEKGGCFEEGSKDVEGLLWNANVKDLEQWQTEAGKRHWQLMRQVLPPVVWDNW